MRLIDADELITAFPCGESVRTESVRATINHMPTIEIGEDCISRKWLEEHKEVIGYTNMWRETETDEFVSWENIESAPSVVPEQRGEWKFKKIFPNDDSEFPMGYLVCSVCGSQHANATPCNYCDNCGAKMKGADDE